MSAASPDKDDFRPKLQMEQNVQNYIPLTEKGVFERIELPIYFNFRSKTVNYFNGDSPHKLNNWDSALAEVSSSTTSYCLCDLPSSEPQIFAGAGTTYSSLSLPSHYVLTNKCIRITGILIIDMDVTIEGGSILTSGSTQIIVQSGNTLNLKDVDEDEGIHSFDCEGLWQGIVVEDSAKINMTNCIIQDALHAVTLLNGSTHTIQNSHFRRNLVGIYVPPGQTPPVIINQASVLFGNIFDTQLVNSNYIAYYFDGVSLVFPDKPYAGIEIHDATFLVGSPANIGFPPNEFRMIENGMIGVNANLSIYDVEMDDIDEMPQAINATPIKGFGIHTSTTSLRVERSKFMDVTTGVAAIGPLSGSFIGTNEFENNYGGVTAIQGGLTVSENSFKNYEARAVYLDNINGLVAENSFRAPTVYTVVPSLGIGWTNTPGYSTSIYAGKIEDNSFRLGIYGMGIQLSNSNKFRIQDNSLIYDPGYTPAGPTGILLNNAPGNDVKYNQISGSLSSFGIRTLQSANNLYCCNTMNNLRGAMAFSGACNSSKVKYNSFGNTAQSSFLCGAGTLIGSQPHFKNTWTGTFSSPPPTVAHAKHDGTPIFIQSSIFEVNTCSAPLFPPSILPFQNCPSSGDWFEFSLDSGITNCGNDLDCAYSEEGGEEGLMINENDMRYLNGDYSEEEYANMVEWQMGKDLYQKLLSDNELINTHEDVTNFYNASQNSALGQLVQINESIIEVGSMSETTINALEAIHNEMESFMTELGNIDSQMSEDLSPEELTNLSNERNEVLVEITTLQSEISDLMTEHTNGAQSTYYSLAGINSSINATSEIEIMEKEVNALFIQSLIDPSYAFNEEENDYLFTVADLCHLHYGSVVFTARSLYFRSEYYHFDDDDICFPDAEFKKDLNDNSLINPWNVSIVPNPAFNRLNISWDYSNTLNKELTISIMDLQGKIVLMRVVDSDSGSIDMDISNYSAGVYLLQGSDNSGVQFTEKVIINK